ncbi:MAG: polyhydroxybutyrate depolymerase [Polyangiales bacterium]|jgi:polyhydroxybutyrate depolymerase
MSRIVPFLAIFLLIACGDDDTPNDAGSATGDVLGSDAPETRIDSGPDSGPVLEDAGTDAGSDAGPPTTVGGDRPARVAVPPDYDPETPTPLLIVLHGYTATGELQNAYLRTEAAAAEHGMLLVLPDGLEDVGGRGFWNATPACCDFGGTGVDDVAYIRGLIEEVGENYNLDSGRVYLFGHSNGGFMSYRMACDAADVITAVASLAGAEFDDATRCEPSQPVSVLQIHGTADGTIRYDGGNNAGNAYPSAEETVSRFGERNGCSDSEAAGSIDFDSGLPGDETDVTRYTGCTEGVGAELWTIQGGAHLPALQPGASGQVLTWLEQFSR